MRKPGLFGACAHARLAAVIGITIGCAGLAIGAPVQQAAPGVVQVVPVRGSMELSGQMIAKPVQPNGERALQAAHDSAVEMLHLEYEVLFREDLVDHYIFKVPQGATEQEVINRLAATGLFEFVEPDWILYPIGCPNDSRFSSQWHHGSTKMQSCDAWGLHQGNSSVTVGICDTGVQTNHPDLLLNREEGYNAVDRRWESQGGQIGPVHSHGTQTTGCAAANGNNGTGVSGAGWNLSHRMLRVSNSSSGSANLSTLTHAALTSIQNGDKVANVSYSGVNSSSVRSTATQIKNLGGLLTWSAGNDGAYLNWGNRDNDDVIVVGSTTSSDNKSNFSAYGPSVDLMAPGSSVFTTTINSSYGSVSGTSFSAPLTAGLIGLLWSSDPSLTPDQVEEILKEGCDDLGSSGPDNTFGYGRINSYQSLQLTGSVNTAPVITINSPNYGSAFTLGDVIQFNTTTIDGEDGNISSQVTWTSHLDGLIGTGNFSTSSLSEGVHFIDVEVTDSGGLTDYEFLSIAVNPASVPNAPTSTSTKEGAPNELTFLWVDNSNNEIGFEVQRQQKVGGSWTNTTIVGTTGANATTYVESVATGGWRYRVRALGDSGDSAWSSYRTSQPARPTNMSASANGSVANFSWSENSGLESGYSIQRQQRVNGTWTNTTTIGSVGANVSSSSDSPGAGEWRYRVQASSLGLNSVWSAWSNRVILP
ncbi:MAG TPA: S8 family serine peptidase [Phycisphaerales bacterium]|nr:S8 family serine peptidase [Phycisphaerales bacterium]